MSSIESRLRDAYRDAADTVSPDTIRQLDERSVRILAPGRRPPRLASRLTIPLSAAAAIALVAGLTAAVPALLSGPSAHHAGHQRPAPAGRTPAGRFVLVDNAVGGLTVRNVLSGASVATVAPPAREFNFHAVATGDGRQYVVALGRARTCRTWLYQFRLDNAGHPGPLTPYALATVDHAISVLAISRDDSTLAYAGGPCYRDADELSVVTLATMRTRQWLLPAAATASTLSLTAHGSMLAYDIPRGPGSGSGAYVLPTSASPGPAKARSRAIATSAQLGAVINSDVITPEGDKIYFTTTRLGAAYGRGWQLRAADLQTGKIRVVGRYPGLVPYLTGGPGVRRALAFVERWPYATPSPSPTPSRSHSRTPSPSPTPSRSHSRTPSPSPTPSRSHRRTPSPSPSPSGHRAGAILEALASSPAPVRSAQQPARFRIVLIDLSTGSSRAINTSRWDVLSPGFAW